MAADPGPAAWQAIALIERASSPEELFGDSPAGGAAGDEARRRYRRLARLTHPDARAGHEEPGVARAGEARAGDQRAARAFAKLTELWRRYQDAPGAAVARGDLANLYPVRAGLLKLAREPADNDLIDREATALTQIRARGPARFTAYFPRIDGIRLVRGPANTLRRGNVMGRLDGFVSLARVRAEFPCGADPRDASWMWRRLLVAIGAAHRAGVIHGAVFPEHVMIQPAQHGLVLIDWCYAGPGPRHQIPAIVARYRDWYPPEVLARRPAGPDADIWLATRCMTGLIAGRMPGPLAAFAAGCLLASPARRPQDAWELLAELDEVLGRLYGPRRFRPFSVPAWQAARSQTTGKAGK